MAGSAIRTLLYCTSTRQHGTIRFTQRVLQYEQDGKTNIVFLHDERCALS